jgi:hypothetical protein
MELAGGRLAGSHVACHSGAGSHVRSGRARIIRRLDDPILQVCWTARIPGVDHARVVAGLCRCLGTLSCVDSSAVESLPLNTCAANGPLGQDQNSRSAISAEACRALVRYLFMFTAVIAVRTGAPIAIRSIVHDEGLT